MTSLRLLALFALILPLTVHAQTVPRAFVPASNSTTASSLAGVPGDHVDEIDGDGFLYRLQFDEHRDRPCFLKAQFWNAPAPGGIDDIETSVITLDICEGNAHPMGDGYAGWTPISMQIIGQSVSPSALTLIDQISIIESRHNNRLKAARVRFGDLKAWRLNQNPVNLGLTDYDSFRRPNADGSTFSEHSTCPSGRAAVGLLVYHEENAQGRHSISGLKLKCARIRRVDEQPTQPPTLQARPRRVINND